MPSCKKSMVIHSRLTNLEISSKILEDFQVPSALSVANWALTRSCSAFGSSVHFSESVQAEGSRCSPVVKPGKTWIRAKGMHTIWRGSHGSLRTTDLSFCQNSCCSTVLGFCTLSSVVGIEVLRPSPFALFQDGPGRRRTRLTVLFQARSRNLPWLLVSRLVSGRVFRCLVV